MKRAIIVAVLSVFILVSGNTLAEVTAPVQDTAITILMVRDGGISDGQVAARVQFLKDTWNATTLSGNTNSTTLEFANNGAAVDYYDVLGGDLDGTDTEQLIKLFTFSKVPFIDILDPSPKPIRDHFSADIMIGITPEIESATGADCGFASQAFWLNEARSFQGDDGEGLDLRGAELQFMAVTAANNTCTLQVPAHEFGHLLGGGHYVGQDPIPLDDKALAWGSPVNTVFGFSFRNVSALARTFTTLCTDFNIPLSQCMRTRTYSDSNFGDSNHQNAIATFLTARSVANYVRGGGGGTGLPPLPMCGDGVDNDGDSFVDSADPDCPSCNEETCPPPPPPLPSCDATAGVTNVTAQLILLCVPGTSQSLWEVNWVPLCPGAVGRYDVWASQPVGDFPLFRWSTVVPSTPVFVLGPDAAIRIQSCGAGGCSGLSSSFAIVKDSC